MARVTKSQSVSCVAKRAADDVSVCTDSVYINIVRGIARDGSPLGALVSWQCACLLRRQQSVRELVSESRCSCLRFLTVALVVALLGRLRCFVVPRHHPLCPALSAQSVVGQVAVAVCAEVDSIREPGLASRRHAKAERRGWRMERASGGGAVEWHTESK